MQGAPQFCHPPDLPMLIQDNQLSVPKIARWMQPKGPPCPQPAGCKGPPPAHRSPPQGHHRWVQGTGTKSPSTSRAKSLRASPALLRALQL